MRDWKPHPTQKPVKLLRYLLEQYTQEGDVVFDPFVGSGTTAVACQQMKRHFVATEANAEYAQIATSRLKEPPKEEAAPDGADVAPEEMPAEDEPEATAPAALPRDEQPAAPPATVAEKKASKRRPPRYAIPTESAPKAP